MAQRKPESISKKKTFQALSDGVPNFLSGHNWKNISGGNLEIALGIPKEKYLFPDKFGVWGLGFGVGVWG
jgi:hypothetical protein